MNIATIIVESKKSAWIAYPDVGESFVVACPPVSHLSPEMLSRFASQVAKLVGQASVRCTMFICDIETPLSQGIISRYPGLVYSITSTLALAHLAELTWAKFLIIDLADGCSASIVFRRNNLLVEELITEPTPDRLSTLLQVLQIQNILIRCPDETRAKICAPYTEAFGSEVQIEMLCDPQAQISGAKIAAESLRNEIGVWQYPNDMLCMNVKHNLTYNLYHPDRATFDVQEDTLKRIVGSRPVLFVMDDRIKLIYGDAIRRYGDRHLNVVGEFVCAGIESEKVLRTVEEICQVALRQGLSRDGLMVAIGGGITLDVVGLAASIFRRGVGYVRVPTSLIGLVDVSVGIKQGVNAFGVKNILGSFYAPLACVLDYKFLRTLPSSCLSAGFAEIIKMALIRDESLLGEIERHGEHLIQSHFEFPIAVGKQIAQRAEVLMLEELALNLFEVDHARLVDFGHTFSPTLETVSNYGISHGDAVALDMMISTSIAVNRSICDPDFLTRMARLFKKLCLPMWHIDMPPASCLCEAFVKARLHRGGALNLVVPTAKGKGCFIQDISVQELDCAMQQLYAVACRSDLEMWSVKESGQHASLSF